ncbi:MAG: sigma-70 family RNA polymerase sigma factor [Cyanobacteria bacterium J06656_5]
MHPRTDTLAMFSTFATFAGDRFDTWRSSPPLARSMQKVLLQSNVPDKSEQFWALYWFRLRHDHPNAPGHLWAYLQEPCFWAAENITRRFTTVQCSPADGFQIAIANVNRILNGYDPDFGSSLKAYAHKAFGNCIRDQLRQQQEINISSDWGLLRRVSQTQLTQALLTAGFVQLGAYILIWQCFKAICIPDLSRSTARGLPPPSQQQFEAIAERYNQMCQGLSPELATVDMGTQDVDTQWLAMELSKLATIVRNYLNPTVVSLNQPQYDDHSGEEPVNMLASDSTPMAELVASEDNGQQQQWMQQINQVLKAAIADLDAPSHNLLVLYYQQKLTQTDIAHQLHSQQYQVSRKLRRIRQQLLLKVATWGKETLHISPESAILGNVSEVIHEWLQDHYSLEPPEVSE